MVDPFGLSIALDALEEIPGRPPSGLSALEQAHEFVRPRRPDGVANLAVSGEASEVVSAP
jgi:hypothetical protein